MTSDQALHIRHARPGDLPAIVRIYNYYVEHSPATFDLEPWRAQDKGTWLAGFTEQGPHQILVAELEGDLCGYAYSTPYRARPAYAVTVESTVYLAPGFAGQGLGNALYTQLFERLQGVGLHTALAAITLPNPPSVALHKSFGFEPVGTMLEVGRKFDRFWDVSWWQKRMGGDSR